MHFVRVLCIAAIASAISAQFTSPAPCRSRLAVRCSCPPEWRLWGDECYRLTPSLHSWDDAKTACRDIGGKMAAPRSPEEMGFMAELAREEIGYYKVWIACSDRDVEGAWECDGQEGRQPFLGWDYGQPDNFGDNQDCAHLSAEFNDRMDDDSCGVAHWAYCVLQPACTYSLIQLRH